MLRRGRAGDQPSASPWLRHCLRAGVFWENVSTPYTGEIVVSADVYLLAGAVSSAEPWKALSGSGCFV